LNLKPRAELFLIKFNNGYVLLTQPKPSTSHISSRYGHFGKS